MRPCVCERVRLGEAWDHTQPCEACWRYHHLRADNLAWGGDGRVVPFTIKPPPAPLNPEWTPPSPPDGIARFEWVSVGRLARDAAALAGLLPPDISGVVGIPRSGILPAGVIATLLQVPLFELGNDGAVRPIGHGGRGHALGFGGNPAGPLAVVDDTTYAGHAMRRARKAVMGPAVYAAVYHRPAAGPIVDVWARVLPSPHLLEWNWANGGVLRGHVAPAYGRGIAVDLDGILLHDAESADHHRAPHLVGLPYMLPRTVPVPLIVTGRRERHRGETEATLRRYGAKWDRLVMYPDDAPAGNEGRWAKHKAEYYAASGCGFYLESCPVQAELIHAACGLPVVCPRTEQVWQ